LLTYVFFIYIIFEIMSNPSADIAVGGQGFKYHGAETVTNVTYDSLVVHVDCVFTSFTVKGNNEASGTNVLTARGLSGITVKAGTFLPAGKGFEITGFVISSGSVIAY
jgi:hypothetical protein